MDKEAVIEIHGEILPSKSEDGIVSFAATWLKLDIIMLSEVS